MSEWDSQRGAQAPITSAPTVSNTTASTTPAVLFTDLAETAYWKVRRIRVVNLDSSIVMALLVKDAGTSLAALTVADGIKIPAGGILTVNVKGSLRVGIVAASGTPSYSAMVSDA